ncbi:hypothetical protein PLANPX_2635 [Lacipirellula parvula]|uniref:Uncharacterized protein n=1 Tax=Lacipirellula parvula TaxID=2650471 RepID=A0A5K7XFL1_9BACT|nr:hypothetical protein PLANPX_2635 [Lacipirellula parvula]
MRTSWSTRSTIYQTTANPPTELLYGGGKSLAMLKSKLNPT